MILDALELKTPESMGEVRLETTDCGDIGYKKGYILLLYLQPKFTRAINPPALVPKGMAA